MKFAGGMLLLAADVAAATTHAGGAHLPLTPSARQLLRAAGLAPDTYIDAVRNCGRVAVNVGGVDGYLAIDAGSPNCADGASDIENSQSRTSFRIAFQATVPITKCISFEDAKDYLLIHGWRLVPPQVNPHMDLMPITADFRDGAGATLTVSPYLRKTCLSRADLRIDAAPTR